MDSNNNNNNSSNNNRDNSNNDNNNNNLTDILKRANNYLFNNNNNNNNSENHKDSASNDLNHNQNNNKNINNNNNSTHNINIDSNKNSISNNGSPTYLNQVTNYIYNIFSSKNESVNNNNNNNSSNNSINNKTNQNNNSSTQNQNDNSSNDNSSNEEGFIYNLIKKKQHEIEDKFDQINQVMNDETIDETTVINKTIDILGRRRFYEILFLFGSASIISYALRTLYFGKTIRAIEIPDGNLTTIVLRSNSVNKLKKTIIQNQPPIYPGVELNIEDIKASVFIDPHFTEPIILNRDVRRLDDGGYVLWTKGDFEIPRTAVGLKSLMKDRELFLRFSTNAEVDKLLRLISLFGPSLILKPQSRFRQFLLKHKLTTPTDIDLIYQDKDEPLTIKERDQLISYVISNSKEREEIFNIYRKYQFNILIFKLHLKNWIKNNLKRY